MRPYRWRPTVASADRARAFSGDPDHHADSSSRHIPRGSARRLVAMRMYQALDARGPRATLSSGEGQMLRPRRGRYSACSDAGAVHPGEEGVPTSIASLCGDTVRVYEP